MTQAFNLSQFANKVNTSGEASLTTAVTGTLPVANGGTGATTLTSGNVLIGAGTSAVTSVAAGASGNVLTSNGSTWTSAAAGGGQLQVELFTSPGTWTKPASCTQVMVTVVAAGGAGSPSGAPIGGAGAFGGFAQAIVPVTGPVAITVASGANAPNATGGSSSFGTAVSATGGGGFPGGLPVAIPGTGTVSTGTALKIGNISLGGTGAGTVSTATYGLISGRTQRVSPTPTAPGLNYSASSEFLAGARGTFGFGSVGGAIVVEFVG